LDNLTHAALGLVIAEAGFRRRIGPAAISLALVASEWPDIDALIGLVSPWTMVQYHRTITHSVLLVPAAAAVLAAIWMRFSRSGRFGPLWALASLAGLSHLLLDLLTSYGTEFLRPISNYKFALDWVPVVDPAVTLLLLGGWALAWRTRNRSRPSPERIALVSLLAVTGYACLGGIQHARAYSALQRATAEFQQPIAQAAIPQVPTIFLWRLTSRTPKRFWVASYNSLTGRIQAQRTLPVLDVPDMTELRTIKEVRQFEAFSRGLIWMHRTGTESDLLVLEDMRFAWPTASPQGIWALRLRFENDPAASNARLRRIEFLQRYPRIFGTGPAVEKAYPVKGPGD